MERRLRERLLAAIQRLGVTRAAEWVQAVERAMPRGGEPLSLLPPQFEQPIPLAPAHPQYAQLPQQGDPLDAPLSILRERAGSSSQ